MRRATLALVLFFLIVSNAFSDHGRLAFNVLKTEDLLELLDEGDSISEVDISKLCDASVAQGYTTTDSLVYLKTKDYQYRIKTKLKKGTLSFSISMFCGKTGKTVFSCSGQLTLPDKFNIPAAREGWRNSKYTAVWYRVNLKK